ncbi:MAG: TlpA disulfide reductase family protein [Tepidisphaeraceae bacterium]
MTRRRKAALGFCLAVLLAGVGAVALRRSAAQSAATHPSVSPEVRALLEQVRQAYASLVSLSISGTFQGHLDIDGIQRNNSAQFAGLYSSAGLFRNETRETTGADPASPQSTSDALLGNNGTNIYLFFPERNRYQMIDAPKGKVNLETLGEDVADILRNQNLALALALSGDAESELLQDATSAVRVDDVTIDGQTYPAILILHPLFDQTLVIDPQTHLLRRMTADVSKNARMKGAKEIKSALLTADYVYSAAATLPAAQFAWSPPPGAQEMIPADAGSDLEGKPAPPFSLTDMDGHQVTNQTLKGSVYVLDFWATWCGPCVASLPHVDALYKDFNGKGVKFFAVNEQEDKPTIQKFVSDTKLSIPVLMDSDAKVGAAFDPDGMIPLTAVVGKDGKVIKAAHMGGVEDQLRPIITEALKR